FKTRLGFVPSGPRAELPAPFPCRTRTPSLLARRCDCPLARGPRSRAPAPSRLASSRPSLLAQAARPGPSRLDTEPCILEGGALTIEVGADGHVVFPRRWRDAADAKLTCCIWTPPARLLR